MMMETAWVKRYMLAYLRLLDTRLGSTSGQGSNLSREVLSYALLETVESNWWHGESACIVLSKGLSAICRLHSYLRGGLWVEIAVVILWFLALLPAGGYS